jgi:UDP-glucose 4-epimerase
MKILITGGTGYLAGRIAQYLNNKNGYQIIIGTSKYLEVQRISSKFNVLHINWDSDENLQLICKGIDTIIHLAGINASDSLSDPIKALEFNGVNTGKLLRSAVKSGVTKFIYFSTAHVYKNPLIGIITEETLPLSLHPYATSHRAGEDMVLAAHSRNEIEGIVFRLSNSIGAPVNKETNCWMLLANDLCKQVIISGKMKLVTNGMQRRNFITITDVCRAVEYFLKFDFVLSKHNLFNLGGNWSPSVWELAVIISRLSANILGYEPQITRIKPSSSDIPENLEYKISKLEETGFIFCNNHEEEILKLLQFCNSNFSITKK